MDTDPVPKNTEGLDKPWLKTAATPERVDYIRYHSKNPSQMIMQKLQGQTIIVGLGEMHRQLDMEQFANSIIDCVAKEKLIRFLALEIDVDNQPDIETFMHTGVVNDNLQQVLNTHNNGYRQILATAKKRGLSVICVDTRAYYGRYDSISRSVLDYSRDHPNEKGIFYAGNGHIIKRQNVLASELGDSFNSVFQVNERSEFIEPHIYDAALKAGITKPVGIDNISQTPFGEAKFGYHYELPSEYGQLVDSLVFLPPVR